MNPDALSVGEAWTSTNIVQQYVTEDRLDFCFEFDLAYATLGAVNGSDADYLARNWLNWIEMSGDHITEQHVHNLDIANWFIGRTPVSAVGFGGRARRESGNSFDFFSVDLDYGDSVHIHSQCRQISGCFNRVGEELRGSKGVVFGGGKLKGDPAITVPDPKSDTDNEGVQEFIDMIRGVRAGQPLNEAQIVAEAGQPGRITVATNMAGRGTDIKLGRGVAEAHGLHVILTERHESRRVDRQLQGRCARQGDPGTIRDLIALDDELLVRHSRLGRWILKCLATHISTAPLGPLAHQTARWVYWQAQKKAGRKALAQRKSVLKSDTWLDEYLGFAGKEM